jgi:hypothetical protein
MSNEGRFLGFGLSVWSGIQGLVAVLGALLAVAGILWGVFEYRGKLEADRAREALNLLDVWETRGYLEQYRALDERVQAVLAEAPAADIAAAEADPAIRAVLYAKAAQTVLQSAEARKEFEAVIYFFERMQICVAADLCATDATALFFEDTLASFAEVFLVPLEDFRTGPPSFLD